MQHITKSPQPEEFDGLLKLDDESWRNLVNFFDLLLQVDKRTNPHLYQLEVKK